MLRKLSLPLGLAAALIFAAPAPALANPFKDHGRAIKGGAKSDSGAVEDAAKGGGGARSGAKAGGRKHGSGGRKHGGGGRHHRRR